MVKQVLKWGFYYHFSEGTFLLFLGLLLEVDWVILWEKVKENLDKMALSRQNSCSILMMIDVVHCLLVILGVCDVVVVCYSGPNHYFQYQIRYCLCIAY